jgi:hypothetical protein
VVTMQSNVQVQWSPRVKMRDISVRHKTCDSLDELSAKPHECCAKCRCRNSGSIMQKRISREVTLGAAKRQNQICPGYFV